MTDDQADDVLDLTAIAQAHPARKVRLDMAAIVAADLLSVGDVVDMAEKLHTEPGSIASFLDGGDLASSIDVGLALAWVIGRKADPALTYDEVRTSWRIEPPPTSSSPPDPTPPPLPRQARRRARATSSG
jgi:hypothetical protein